MAANGDLTANVGEVPMTQAYGGVPPPEMEPQIGGGMYAAAIAAAPAATWGLRLGHLNLCRSSQVRQALLRLRTR